MSKEAIAKRKKEILAAIADPKVREHYRMQLDEAERLEEEEGVVTAFHEVFSDDRPVPLPDEQAPVDVFGQPTAFLPRSEPLPRPERPESNNTGLIMLGVGIGLVLAAVVVWLLGKL